MLVSRKTIIAGVVFAAALLLVSFPARLAFGLFAPQGVTGFGIGGTIWQGNARIISINGQQFRNTEWDIAVFRLLLGQLGGDFKTRWAGGFLEGSGTISIGGTLELTDTVGSFNAASLEPLLGIPQVGGQVSMQVSQFEAHDNWPYKLIGTVEIRNFSSPLMGAGAADVIGNIALDFDTATETNSDTITGKLTDVGGPLEIKGTLLLTPPGNYNLKARIKARPNAPEALYKNLEFLGQPEADGMRIFQIAGSI